MSVPVPPAANPGAVQLDYALQSGQAGLMQIVRITGSPEAVIYARPGTVVTNELGALYVKQSQGDLATGWRIATLT